MYYSVLRLPNGTELKGGEAGSTLKALTLHTAVNAGQEFTIGSAFSTSKLNTSAIFCEVSQVSAVIRLASASLSTLSDIFVLYSSRMEFLAVFS